MVMRSRRNRVWLKRLFILVLTSSCAPAQEESKKTTGRVCSSNLDCESNTCRSGACMASSACYPIKHKFGMPFDTYAANLVFVASGFDSDAHDVWRAQVETTYQEFRKNIALLSKPNDNLNVFLVDPLSGPFCEYGCGTRIDRLLCCDFDTADSLSSQCFQGGATRQTVVIHNDEKFGGAGYVANNMVTLSTHPDMPSDIMEYHFNGTWRELAAEYATATRMPIPKSPTTNNPTPVPTLKPTQPLTHRPTTTPTIEPTKRPTIRPIRSPTHAPSLKPTALPTPHPTVSPTHVPTKAPSKPPTQSPTPSPTTTEPNPFPTPVPTTLQPTPIPTPLPTSSPTPLTTPKPTQPPTPGPTNAPTTDQPTQAPTWKLTYSPSRNPTVSPTLDPTKLPTKPQTELPTLELTLPPTPENGWDAANTKGSWGTGKVCSVDSDCKSNTCRHGACMASPDCYPIQRKFGSPFDTNTINIVFVPSAFDTATHEEWRTHVNNTYRVFEQFNMFSKDIEQLNVFFVDPSEMEPSFCEFGCVGVDRLLCCDIQITHALSSKCFPVGQNLQTVVIHNSRKYGGAGYTYQNIATASVHVQAPLVAAHELGHSLFQLVDEYSYGTGTGVDPNCDSRKKCKKWSDLLGRKKTPAGYDTVQCIPGCKGNNYYIGMQSFMDDLSKPMGAVNERFTCCTYQMLTKSMPSYCNVFDFSPDYLFNYCKNNDYQDYGASNYDAEPKMAIPGVAQDEEDKNAKYLYVSDPVLVTVTTRIRKNGSVATFLQQTRLPPGIFHRSQIEGDFSKIKAAEKKGVDSLLKVLVFYGTGKEILLFSRKTMIEVPLPEPNGAISEQNDEPRVVSEKSDVVEVVLDTKGRRIDGIRAKILEIQ